MGEIRSVRMNDLALTVDCAEQHRWFWDEVAQANWEQETLQAFAETITPDTLYVDIGAWIGPTVLYGGSRARRVVAVEPDAVAMAALIANLEQNPSIRDKVSFHNHALAAETSTLEMWAYRFGDSMTSVLPNRGGRKITFLAMGVREFLDRVLGDEPHCFIKVDVEGAEYGLVPALCAELTDRRVAADLFVSFHASFSIDEERTTRSWSANVARNAQLLSVLAEYGDVHVYGGGAWKAAQSRFHDLYVAKNFLEYGGLDTTLLIKARR